VKSGNLPLFSQSNVPPSTITLLSGSTLRVPAESGTGNSAGTYEAVLRKRYGSGKNADESDKIASVTYPNLPDDPYHEMAKKYLPNGTCGVISISIKGGREAAVRFMDALQLASIEVHVADIRTCVLHPASATHRQLTEEQLKAAGIDGGLIRISVGLENIEDILADLQQALERV